MSTAESSKGRQDPYRSFRFRVELEYANHETVVASFTQFSGIRMTTDTLQARAGSDVRGVQSVIPTLTRFEPVTLSQGVVGDNEFLNWLFDAVPNDVSGPRTLPQGRNIRIVVLDDRGSTGIVWSLLNAVPIGYALSPMDGSNSEVLAESLTFAIGGVARVNERGLWEEMNW